MHQTRRNFEFLQVSTMVICLSLLLVPQISSAGGLGDLFPGDIVEKIKSTGIKGVLQPSEKGENASDSAPSQSNSAPTVAHAAPKEVTPVESSTPPAKAVEPVKTSTPPVAASPAVAQEAEEVKAWCYKKAFRRNLHDCECVAREFQDGLLADPKAEKESLRNLIFSNNQCPNYEGTRELQYKECISMRGYGKFPSRNEAEAFCQCVGKQVAEKRFAHKGEPGAAHFTKFTQLAIAQCR